MPDTTLYAYLTPNVVLASTCVFLLVKRIAERRPEVVTSRTMSIIGDSSFGIYLVHPFFQAVLLSLGLSTTLIPEMVSVPLFALALFVPSLIVAAVLHRIPRVGRYLA